jgi:hypothetical protein
VGGAGAGELSPLVVLEKCAALDEVLQLVCKGYRYSPSGDLAWRAN